MPLCGICKTEKAQGTFFHACEEMWYERLFICRDCRNQVPVQRSYHEMCYECGQHWTERERMSLDPPPLLVQELADALQKFQDHHASLLGEIPYSTDVDDMHPGSLSEDLKKWREKHRKVTPDANG